MTEMHPRHRCGERGMVTAELAVSLLSLAALLVGMTWVVLVVMLQIRCFDTAAEVARQSARDDMAAVVRAKADAPRGAQVTERHNGDLVEVEVRLSARPFAGLPAVPLTARAAVTAETGQTP